MWCVLADQSKMDGCGKMAKLGIVRICGFRHDRGNGHGDTGTGMMRLSFRQISA